MTVTTSVANAKGTWDLIQNIVPPNGGFDTISFSSIPQTYTDLVVVYYASFYNPGAHFFMRINGSSSAIYNWSRYQSGSASTTQNETRIICFGQDSTGAGNGWISLPNYSNTSTNKVFHVKGSFATTNNFIVGSFASTSAITSLSFSTTSTAWGGCNFSLYGIKAA